MPNRHDIDKICVSNWVKRPLAQKLRVLARERGFESVSDLILWVYTDATKNVVLSPADFRVIAAETEAAEARLDRRRSTKK